MAKVAKGKPAPAKAGKQVEAASGQWADRLAQGNQAWTDAPVGGFKNVPPGHYTFLLEEAVIFESKKSQELMLRVKWTVAEGEHKGESATEFFSLENEERYSFLKERIESLGYQVPDNKQDIEELVADLNRQPPVVVATVKVTKAKDGNEYTNIKDLQVMDDASIAPEAEEAEAEADAPAEEEAATEEEAPAEEAAEDAPAEETEEAVVAVGSLVSFVDDDDVTHEGKVLKIAEDVATVKDADSNAIAYVCRAVMGEPKP
jgi:hypothetical protein